ncbi:hypothetical protein [Amycolatopsis saalfeldensis]|uniref:Uncharacterized protein n=1 Tax=Amycolatopsis saalfeldensis TaxID=394193 RepID=A0A1H8R1D4_9PSEU|nr:hypothetical protein [Amycolatopsis saalfeldensis]SEO60419.1 hypothetical protein SAMN04489732_101584 [Amycolatopsis saalfeldensis]
MSSELARIELASAVTAAKRTGRIPDASVVLDHFDWMASQEGPVVLIPFRPQRIFLPAKWLVMENYPLRTLDARQRLQFHSTAIPAKPGPGSRK